MPIGSAVEDAAEAVSLTAEVMTEREAKARIPVVSKPRSITHVIFDVDGLLLDTESLDSQTIQQIVSKHGKTYTWEVKKKVMGRIAIESARVLVDELQLPMTPEEYVVEREVIHREALKACEMMPGAERLVRHLHSCGIPVCVATSSASHMFEAKITRHKELFSLFDHLVLGDDPEIRNGKPAPDIFLIAAKRFASESNSNGAPAPSKCLVFEDSPNGVAAANAANMPVVWVPDSRLSRDAAQPTAVISSLLEFEPEKWGLPPFPSS